jgi:hypothetical protein
MSYASVMPYAYALYYALYNYKYRLLDRGTAGCLNHHIETIQGCFWVLWVFIISALIVIAP